MPRKRAIPVDRATIHITDLSLRTIIGINDWERTKPQDVVINIAVDFDPSDAVRSDRLDDTVDYKRIKRRVIALVEKSRFGLIERMAYEILREVLSHDRVEAATVRVDKPQALRFTRSVSVEMHAERPS